MFVGSKAPTQPGVVSALSVETNEVCLVAFEPPSIMVSSREAQAVSKRLGAESGGISTGISSQQSGTFFLDP